MTKILLFTAATLLSAGPAIAGTDSSYLGLYGGISATSPHYEEPGAVGMESNPSMFGAAVGVFAGHDLKSKTVLIGVEADFGLLDNDAPHDPSGVNWYTAYKSKWNAHVRGRVGVAVDRSTKVYLTGGVAALRMTIDDTDPNWGIVTKTHYGWSAGAGFEHRIGRKLGIHVDYFHDDFKARTGNIDYQGVPTYETGTAPTSDTFRIGIAYRF